MSLSTNECSITTDSVFEANKTNNTINSSGILREESALQNGSKLESPTSKLSITFAQNEKDMLCSTYRSEKYVIKTSTNGSLDITADTLEETFLKSVTEKVSPEDETIISLEEDDGDEVMEISNLESTAPTETPQKEMFSHLQPIKDYVPEKMELEKAEESVLDEERTLNFYQDESMTFQNNLIEVGRRLWPSTAEKQQYTKGCLWSPDGTCLLVPVHLDGMHVVELPSDLYTATEVPNDRALSNLSTAVHVKEGGTVYDFCWYPYMNSEDPATCCWLATRQHEPIHMWDAFTGELRCSYRGYDEVDEVESAISVVFSSDSQKIIGGYKKTIKIFDTNIPGRSYNSITVNKAVSCFALTTDNDNSVTAGTWTGFINHYDLRAPKLGPLFTLGGHSGGITYLKYVPTKDHNWYLFSGARKDNKILQWDMRNYLKPVETFNRNVQTNQRIYYDLTPSNEWLASGDTEGLLRIWNLGDESLQFQLHLHQDCCNGVSFHPSLPIVSTSSGQYHFTDVSNSDDKCTDNIVNYENSLLILWYGPTQKNKE